ncbi:MAG: DUF255 domain-containing protein [Rhodospirillaceae bacterium]|nr:DUF255 domain-containing protein [Rhodospirillaceae bacterium]
MRIKDYGQVASRHALESNKEKPSWGRDEPDVLQHRDNPVHWWAWGGDAFAAAYICRGSVCQAQVTTADDLKEALAG